MTKNIKEIGKELLGKSLNSFHRKTGLTQLEKNNEMQDGILNGILSQVDDAYIEKTEQSNVLHLDGSGDGVVVLDSIEGNTLVNLWNFDNVTDRHNVTYSNKVLTLTSNNAWGSCRLKLPSIKQNTVYTLIVNILENTTDSDIVYINDCDASRSYFTIAYLGVDKLGINKVKVTSKNEDLSKCNMGIRTNSHSGYIKLQYVILEGDWTDKEIPPYFEGLQSSFEEKVNDEGKYEIEILSRTKNIFNINTVEPKFSSTNDSQNYPSAYYIKDDSIVFTTSTSYQGMANLVKVQKGKTYTFYSESPQSVRILLKPCDINNKYAYTDTIINSSTNKTITFIAEHDYYWFMFDSTSGASTFTISNIQIQEGSTLSDYVPHKQNKIKLLINEPLRGVGDVKDRFVFKNGKLMIERNCGEIILDGSENWTQNNQEYGTHIRVQIPFNGTLGTELLCDRFVWDTVNVINKILCVGNTLTIFIEKSKLTTPNVDGFKQWLQANPTTVIYQLAEPIYEEVLNEYGEPILLEGYENGTLYIDSTIIPTTTVRYTPKMESFNALKEVSNNNIMLTNDINNTIVPYMMEVDLMIMEKEVALMSQKNIRKIGAEDMTSMQKRTQQMLERLIKGKTLNEQECKTRVTVYLNAGKITDEQAKELNFLIDEIYA